MNQSADIIAGQRLVETLREVSGAKCYCRMEMRHTSYSWITLILSLQTENHSNHLSIDNVTGFEDALLHSQDNEIVIEFVAPDGVPCQFKTLVLECRPEAIIAELPESIYRMQKRKYFRVKAGLETVIVFQLGQAVEEKGVVRDYGLGGLAFFREHHLKLTVGDKLKEIELRIPEENEAAIFHIPTAVVRRIEPQVGGRSICALEFLEMSEATTEQLSRRVFKEQRLMLQKVNRVQQRG